MIWLLVGIALIATVLLFPVTIRARSSGSEGIIDGSLSISWLILAIQYELKNKQTDILILGRTLIHRQHKESLHDPRDTHEHENVFFGAKTPGTKDIKKSVKSRFIPSVQDFIPLIGPLMRLIRDLLSTFKFRHFKLDTVYGLEDPAYTGMLTGYLHALSYQYNISFTPDFTQPVLDWDLDLATAFTPIAVVVPITRFATNPKVLRSGWKIVRS